MLGLNFASDLAKDVSELEFASFFDAYDSHYSSSASHDSEASIIDAFVNSINIGYASNDALGRVNLVVDVGSGPYNRLHKALAGKVDRSMYFVTLDANPYLHKAQADYFSANNKFYIDYYNINDSNTRSCCHNNTDSAANNSSDSTCRDCSKKGATPAPLGSSYNIALGRCYMS